MSSTPPVVVVEDDPWTRLVGIVLDPTYSEEATKAFADFVAHDEPNFVEWRDQVRARVGALYPRKIQFVSSPEGLRAHLPTARAVVVEALSVGRNELEHAPRLEVVQKYGAVLRNIDVAACSAAGIKVVGIRRRANIACAELAFGLMLALAKHVLRGQRPSGMRLPDTPLDGGHAPTSERLPAETGCLHGSTIGIIGLGEIGREIALRAAAFGMNVLYFQRTRLAAGEEARLRVSYRPLDVLLGQSDWVVPQLPSDASTRHFIDRERLKLMKRGACLINVARAEIAERDALIEALRSGHLGGFALDPLYEAPGRSDDELLAFKNVILTPHIAGSPRTNGLRDLEVMLIGLADALHR